MERTKQISDNEKKYLRCSATHENGRDHRARRWTCNKGKIRAKRITLHKRLAVSLGVNNALLVQLKGVGNAVRDTATAPDVRVLDDGA